MNELLRRSKLIYTDVPPIEHPLSSNALVALLVAAATAAMELFMIDDIILSLCVLICDCAASNIMLKMLQL